MMELTLRGTFSFFSPDWDEVSQNAQDFISALIQVDPVKRLTCAQALDHVWVKSEAKNEKNLIDKVGNNLVTHFNARKKLKVSKINDRLVWMQLNLSMQSGVLLQ